MFEKKGENTKKNTTPKLMHSLYLIFVSAIALAVATFAWIINNTNIQADAVNIIAKDTRFEIMTQNTDGSLSTSTSGSDLSIDWILTPNSNFANDGIDEKLNPGVNGSITFYVVPKVDDINSVVFNISIVPYEQTLLPDYEIEYTKDSNTYHLNTISDETINKLVQGHFLFFKEARNNPSVEIFRIENDELVQVNFPKDLNGKTIQSPVAVTLHWIWPLKFQYFVDDSNSPHNLFSTPEKELDLSEMINQMNDLEDKNKYFYNRNEAIPNFTVNKFITMSTSDKHLANDLYNKADQYLGENVNFLGLEVFVKEGNI